MPSTFTLLLRLCSCESALLAIVACGTTLKRYDSLVPGTVLDTSVSVAVYSIPLPASDPKTIFNLAERGQAAAIAALAPRTATPGELLASVAAPLEASTPVAPVLDRTKIRRRLVISIRHDTPWLADRVAILRAEITPKDSGVRLVGWDKLTTRYETVDLGKSTVTNTAALTAGYGAASSREVTEEAVKTTASSTPSVGVTAGQTAVEETLLRQRYIAVSGELSEKSASVVLEGVPGLDLSGNVLADLDLVLPQDNYWGVVTAIEDAKPPAEVTQCSLHPTLRITPMYLPKPAAYDASLKLTYSVRRVSKGGATLTESDDEVQIGVPSKPLVQEFSLVGPKDFSATLWYVYASQGFVHMKDYNNTSYLVFNSLGLAQQALKLLKQCDTNYFGVPLFLGGGDKALTKEHLVDGRVDAWDALQSPAH